MLMFRSLSVSLSAMCVDLANHSVDSPHSVVGYQITVGSVVSSVSDSVGCKPCALTELTMCFVMCPGKEKN